MLLPTRKQALAMREPAYNTGKMCRNGHYADRYTSSGACKECLTESVAGVRRALDWNPRTAERTAQRELLVQIRLRAHPVDAGTLLDCAVSMTQARHSAVAPTDIVGNRRGIQPEGGTLLYLVNVDAADVQMLRDMQNAMLTARGPNVEQLRAVAFGGAMAQAEAARDNGEGEWRFT
jgi:hypothetical protein